MCVVLVYILIYDDIFIHIIYTYIVYIYIFKYIYICSSSSSSGKLVLGLGHLCANPVTLVALVVMIVTEQLHNGT